MLKMFRFVKCNGRDMSVRLILLNKFKFKMPVVAANLAAVAVVVDILG